VPRKPAHRHRDQRIGFLQLVPGNHRLEKVEQGDGAGGIELQGAAIVLLGVRVIPPLPVEESDVVDGPHVLGIDVQHRPIGGQGLLRVQVHPAEIGSRRHVALEIGQPVPMGIRLFDRIAGPGRLGSAVTQVDPQLAPGHGKPGIQRHGLFQQAVGPIVIAGGIGEIHRLGILAERIE
jgi:hypothetical protein